MTKTAKEWLAMAIRRHEKHMRGEEPTEGHEGRMSQMLLMLEMKFALKGINSGAAIESTEWYNNHIDTDTDMD